jgi:hypothetical protein
MTEENMTTYRMKSNVFPELFILYKLKGEEECGAEVAVKTNRLESNP